MKEKNETGLIFKQLPKIASEIEAVGKNQQNKQQGFKFRGVDDVYNAVSKAMANHGVFSTTAILDQTFTEVETRSGSKGVHARVKYVFTFWAEDGSWVQQEAFGEGIDYGDKVTNKCASIAHKYALLQIFCIPTEDMSDPDRETHDIKPASRGLAERRVSKESNGDGGGGDKKASVAHVERLVMVVKDNPRWSITAVKQKSMEKFGTEKFSDLTVGQITDLAKTVKNGEPTVKNEAPTA